jgi:ABC-type polysaccharide/polyol phosphate export permease
MVREAPDSALTRLPQALPAQAGEGWVTSRPPRLAEVALRVVTFPRLLAAHRDLIKTSVRRELSTRFRGTLLGWLWPLLQPVALFAVYYFIFTRLLGVKFPELPADQQQAFGVFMFVGLVIWAAFAEAVMRGTNSIVDNGNLIKKLSFPSEVLPLNVVLVSHVTMLFAVAVFLLACYLTPAWIAPDAHLAWAPLLFVLQIFFTYGIALFLSALQVFLRDTAQLMQVLMTIWMFGTPIFWTPEVIPNPEETIGPFLGLVEANPMFSLVYAWRVALMSAEPALVLSADPAPHVARLALWAVGAFVLGYGFFILAQRRFADEV